MWNRDLAEKFMYKFLPEIERSLRETPLGSEGAALSFLLLRQRKIFIVFPIMYQVGCLVLAIFSALYFVNFLYSNLAHTKFILLYIDLAIIFNALWFMPCKSNSWVCANLSYISFRLIAVVLFLFYMRF